MKSVLSQAVSSPNAFIMETQILHWASQVVGGVVCYVFQLDGYHAAVSGRRNTTACVSGEHYIPRESCLCIENQFVKYSRHHKGQEQASSHPTPCTNSANTLSALSLLL